MSSTSSEQNNMVEVKHPGLHSTLQAVGAANASGVELALGQNVLKGETGSSWQHSLAIKAGLEH